jgi:hypothetical protein
LGSVDGNMGCANLKNKVIKPKTRVAGETGPKLSSDEELRAQFSTVRNRKNQRNLQTMRKAE